MIWGRLSCIHPLSLDSNLSTFPFPSFEIPIDGEFHQFCLSPNAFGKTNRLVEEVANPRQQLAFAGVVLGG